MGQTMGIGEMVEIASGERLTDEQLAFETETSVGGVHPCVEMGPEAPGLAVRRPA